jgi:hypothetical protein
MDYVKATGSVEAYVMSVPFGDEAPRGVVELYIHLFFV